MERLLYRNALGLDDGNDGTSSGRSAGTSSLQRTLSSSSSSLCISDTNLPSELELEGDAALPPVRRITLAKAMLAEACDMKNGKQ